MDKEARRRVAPATPPFRVGARRGAWAPKISATPGGCPGPRPAGPIPSDVASLATAAEVSDRRRPSHGNPLPREEGIFVHPMDLHGDAVGPRSDRRPARDGEGATTEDVVLDDLPEAGEALLDPGKRAAVEEIRSDDGTSPARGQLVVELPHPVGGSLHVLENDDLGRTAGPASSPIVADRRRLATVLPADPPQPAWSNNERIIARCQFCTLWSELPWKALTNEGA